MIYKVPSNPNRSMILVDSSAVMQVERGISAYCLWGTLPLHGKQKEIPKALFSISVLWLQSPDNISSHGEDISKHLLIWVSGTEELYQNSD